ncbi:recombinase family protein [Hymenobacter arcticus]
MKIGYARVSTRDQNLELQLDALHKAGCETIYQEKVSGASASRPELERLLTQLRTSDTVYIYKLDRLDRLGRSLCHLLQVVGDLQQMGVGLVSLTDAINKTSAQGRLVFNLFASLAEFERELIRERTHAGLASARARGRRPSAGPFRRSGAHSHHRRNPLPRAATRRQRDCPAPAHLQSHPLQILTPPQSGHPRPPQTCPRQLARLIFVPNF